MYFSHSPLFSVHIVPGLTTSKGLALALQADDPHTTEFTLAILHMHENNVLDNLNRKWWETNNECPQEKETSKEPALLAIRV